MISFSASSQIEASWMAQQLSLFHRALYNSGLMSNAECRLTSESSRQHPSHCAVMPLARQRFCLFMSHCEWQGGELSSSVSTQRRLQALDTQQHEQLSSVVISGWWIDSYILASIIRLVGSCNAVRVVRASSIFSSNPCSDHLVCPHTTMPDALSYSRHSGFGFGPCTDYADTRDIRPPRQRQCC